jgi:hypothetical protein
MDVSARGRPCGTCYPHRPPLHIAQAEVTLAAEHLREATAKVASLTAAAAEADKALKKEREAAATAAATAKQLEQQVGTCP